MIYISDLDGTLLDHGGQILPFTKRVIHKMNEKNIPFTIATARSYHSAKEIIKELDLQHPVILRNGATIYHPKEKCILINRTIDHIKAKDIIELLLALKINPIVHSICDQNEFVDYRYLQNHGEKTYINNRIKNQDKRIRKVEKFAYQKNDVFIAFCSIDEDQKQRQALKIIQNKYDDYSIHVYPDNYSNGTWLEINHHKATKQYGAQKVLELLNMKEYVAFGDNENDIGMLQHAKKSFITDQSYLSKQNHGFDILASCQNEGVAKYLSTICE